MQERGILGDLTLNSPDSERSGSLAIEIRIFPNFPGVLIINPRY